MRCDEQDLRDEVWEGGGGMFVHACVRACIQRYTVCGASILTIAVMEECNGILRQIYKMYLHENVRHPQGVSW